MAGGPCSFDNCLLVLEKLSGVGDIAKLGFSRVVFWIQIPNAPLLCMTKEMGEFLGQLISELVDIDVRVSGECFGKYIRLKVAIDISKPLKRFPRIELVEGEESILLLRYERLSEYYFHCGIISHSYQECHNKIKEGRSSVNMQFDYGPWLRASSPTGQNKAYSQYRQQGKASIDRFAGRRKGVRTTGLSGISKESWRPKTGGDGVWFQGTVSQSSLGTGKEPSSDGGSKGTNVVIGMISVSVDMLIDVSVTEIMGSITLDMDGKFKKLASGADVGNKAAVPLTHGKKKGKWKRWAREGGQRDSEPKRLLQVEKNQVSNDGERSESSDLKKQRIGNAFDFESIEISASDFQALVQNSCGSVVDGDSMQGMVSRLSSCTGIFQRWNKTNKKVSVENIVAKKQELAISSKVRGMGPLIGNIVRGLKVSWTIS
ncbi:hypothetical protein EZV62_010904 [Acer yangbiense]|uniref:Zinc knuckle CX2CX4HX4C domain-containing protein n=1 Tax=Acer yangbiense TaxID=1000413 RepID=A0A5C7I3V5_9ROSI|nr:hypothetical protein EZV62_010904 [Acer yangbiense]